MAPKTSPPNPAGPQMQGDAPTRLRWTVSENEAKALFPHEAEQERHLGVGEYRGMEFFHVNAKRIINEVPTTSHVPFRFTINAYRGCSHACVYCFARPTHRYLDLDIGKDFDSKIVVKINAVERLRAELRSSGWQCDPIAMGTNTDPYQKAEGRYHLTRRIIQTLSDVGNPFSILTKSTLVLRDLDVLCAATERTTVRMNFSIGTLDREVWRLTEPGTPPPNRRIEAVRRLNQAGIPCGVLVAPVLPGLSDSDGQLQQVVDACVDAGAVSVTPLALRLRGEVRDHYFSWLTSQRPDLIALYEERFNHRAYQRRADCQSLSKRVGAMVRKARGRAGRQPMVMPSSARRLTRTEDHAARTDPASKTDPEQLCLDLHEPS